MMKEISATWRSTTGPLTVEGAETVLKKVQRIIIAKGFLRPQEVWWAYDQAGTLLPDKGR